MLTDAEIGAKSSRWYVCMHAPVHPSAMESKGMAEKLGNQTVTESQNIRGWKGPLWVI